MLSSHIVLRGKKVAVSSDASVTGLAFIVIFGPIAAAAITYAVAAETKSRWAFVPGIILWLGAVYAWIVVHTWLTVIHQGWFHASENDPAGMVVVNIIMGIITAIVSFLAFGAVLFEDSLYVRPQSKQPAKKAPEKKD